MIIWGFGWLSPLTHARLNRMSSAPPVPPFQLPRLTECLYSLPTAVTNPSMPGMRSTQDAEANKLPGRLGQREHVSVTKCSLSTSNLARVQNQDWFGPILMPVELTYVYLMCQHLYKNMSQLGRKKRKINWPCAILPDAVPQYSRLSITSVCSTASALPPWLPLMRRDAHWANAN